MRKITASLCLLCIFITFSACSFVGETDFAMFEERFNKANENIQLESSNITREEQNDNTKYNCFFDAEGGGKYMITVNEKSDKNIITSCTLCVLSSIKLNTDTVKELFCSMLFAYAQIDEQKSSEIFEELKLYNESTYQAFGSVKHEFENPELNIEIIVNGAGTAITVT